MSAAMERLGFTGIETWRDEDGDVRGVEGTLAGP
jgi:hypothetical protein